MNIKVKLEKDGEVSFDTDVEGIQIQYTKTGQRVKSLIINNKIRVRSSHIKFYRPFELDIEKVIEMGEIELKLDSYLN